MLARYRKGVKIIDLKGDSSSGTSVVLSGKVSANSEVVTISDDNEIDVVNSRMLEEDVRTSKGKCISVTGKKLIGGFIREV